MTPSVGKILYNRGLKQGVYFNASIISENERGQWIETRSQISLRSISKTNSIPDSALIIVTSQDCDISCSNDELDKCIELAVFKKIKNKKKHAGNQFVKSVKKLQIKVNEQWYEAKVEYIIQIEKTKLVEILTNPDDIYPLPKAHHQSIPLWRANRYLRTALPDNFNQKLYPIFEIELPELEKESKRSDNTSYIRALYIKLNSFNEEEHYYFELFALLTFDTPNQILSNIQDIIEAISDKLVDQGYIDNDNAIYADRDSSTYVSYLTHFVKINLDHHSLASSDNEVGPTL